VPQDAIYLLAREDDRQPRPRPAEIAQPPKRPLHHVLVHEHQRTQCLALRGRRYPPLHHQMIQKRRDLSLTELSRMA
jgi:hypothetical protein